MLALNVKSDSVTYCSQSRHCSFLPIFFWPLPNVSQELELVEAQRDRGLFVATPDYVDNSAYFFYLFHYRM
jgi:hypothetical protein